MHTKTVEDFGLTRIQYLKKELINMDNYGLTNNSPTCFGEEGSTGTGN
jgi:hypothetical protein